MNRVSLLLSIYILLNYCHNALTKTPSDTEVDIDKIGKEREGVDDDNGHQKLFDLDYGLATSSRQEDSDGFGDTDRDNDLTQLKNKQVQGDDRYLKQIVVLDSMDTRNYRAELQAGNKAVLMGTNPHYYQPKAYPDFSRRFVPQYPYTEVGKKNKDKIEMNKLTPQLAPPELVLQVAKESAILDAAEHKDPTVELIRKDILRTGDYWNSVWKEDVDPQVLRTNNASKLESVRAEIPPGKLYSLIKNLKKISPTLVYVINEKKT